MDTQIWAEVVTIGSELVLGQLLDTNASYIATCLSEIGVGMAYHTTVGDDPARMREVLNQALERCQVVITTGGIGPTEDDLTREVAAQVFGRELVLRQDLLDHITAFFKKAGFSMAPNNRKQAYIPDGAEVIHNPRGTAPCFRYEQGDRVLVCLPGVPHETEPLIREEIMPFLLKKYGLAERVWVNRVLKVCGIGESNVDNQIKDIIKASENPYIGLQAAPGEIKIRLTARAATTEEAKVLLDRGEAEIRDRLGPLIYGFGDETLAGNTAHLLEQHGLTLATADAQTRGHVTAELGRHLPPGLLKGGLILERPAPAADLCQRILTEFGAELALAVAGFPADEGRTRLEIAVRTKTGRSKDRTLILGGRKQIVAARSTIMSLFTLLTFLRDDLPLAD